MKFLDFCVGMVEKQRKDVQCSQSYDFFWRRVFAGKINQEAADFVYHS